MVSLATVASSYRAKMVEISRALYAGDFQNDGEVWVLEGAPVGVKLPPDIVSWQGLNSEHDFANFGTNRDRDELLNLDVVISSQRGGRTDETEAYCRERAYAILAELEEYVRSTDPTLGDLMLSCHMLRHTSYGVTSPAVIKDGRCYDIRATFQARARISN